MYLISDLKGMKERRLEWIYEPQYVCRRSFTENFLLWVEKEGKRRRTTYLSPTFKLLIFTFLGPKVPRVWSEPEQLMTKTGISCLFFFWIDQIR